jgi:hypothetical protein
MGGFLKTVLDPAGVFDGLADPGGPTSAPVPGPMAQPGSLAHMAGMAGMNPESGYIGGMTGPSTGLSLPDAGKDYGPQVDAPRPRVAPFAAQWSFTPGKGPQWMEPVDNGVTSKPKRQGDLIQTETVDNGWSSQISNGPAKGNRF